jgi:hypothetical protein
MTTAFARRMPRSLIAAALALASTLTSFAVIVTPAVAAPRGGAYAATLATPLTQPRREIVEGAVWRCQGDRCSAPADGARALTICSKVSRRFGEVARFSTPQGELATAELARCNAG